MLHPIDRWMNDVNRFNIRNHSVSAQQCFYVSINLILFVITQNHSSNSVCNNHKCQMQKTCFHFAIECKSNLNQQIHMSSDISSLTKQ